MATDNHGIKAGFGATRRSLILAGAALGLAGIPAMVRAQPTRCTTRSLRRTLRTSRSSLTCSLKKVFSQNGSWSTPCCTKDKGHNVHSPSKRSKRHRADE